MTDQQALIEDEILAIRQSGEMPEVALHGALHFLRDDPDGPGICLTAGDIDRLKYAVEARYRRILMRDLTPRYRDKSVYRGVSRAMANWHRLERFCRREGRPAAEHRRAAAAALLDFLSVETRDVKAGRPPAAVDCTPVDLLAFARELGAAPDLLPEGWQATCARSSPG